VYTAPDELVDFELSLHATNMDKGFLGLFLYATPPKDFRGNYGMDHYAFPFPWPQFGLSLFCLRNKWQWDCKCGSINDHPILIGKFDLSWEYSFFYIIKSYISFE
jgi:hypothetical protein